MPSEAVSTCNIINVKRNNIYFSSPTLKFHLLAWNLYAISVFLILITFIFQNPSHPVPTGDFDSLMMAPLSGSYVCDALIYTDQFWCTVLLHNVKKTPINYKTEPYIKVYALRTSHINLLPVFLVETNPKQSGNTLWLLQHCMSKGTSK